jgi:hypothetical protein
MQDRTDKPSDTDSPHDPPSTPTTSGRCWLSGPGWWAARSPLVSV